MYRANYYPHSCICYYLDYPPTNSTVIISMWVYFHHHDELLCLLQWLIHALEFEQLEVNLNFLKLSFWPSFIKFNTLVYWPKSWRSVNINEGQVDRKCENYVIFVYKIKKTGHHRKEKMVKGSSIWIPILLKFVFRNEHNITRKIVIQNIVQFITETR
jgi:hypothetical protein